MPKSTLYSPDSALEAALIDTMLAGLKQWRPDLSYPESHSDLQGCVRAVMSMFEVRRRPIAAPLRLRCSVCEEAKHLIRIDERGTRCLTTCPDCRGRGYTEAAA